MKAGRPGGPDPVLVAVAHGTRDPRGAPAVRALLSRVRRARPDLEVREAYVELCSPLLCDVLGATDRPLVVVPLLLATGYHVKADLPRALHGRTDAVVARALGPDPLLVEAVVDRLHRSAHRPGDPVVLAAAGSADPEARAHTELVAGALARRTGAEVRVAYASAAQPGVEEAVRSLREEGHARVTAASYLLAPGRFSDRVARAGADVVTDVLGDSEPLARLVLRRWAGAARVLGRPAAHRVTVPVG